MTAAEKGLFVGLQLPRRKSEARGSRRPRRAALVATLGLALLVLSGCGQDTALERLAMPEPVSREGEFTLDLWQGAWIAALLTGLVVWGLIFYVVWKYRRRSADEVPVQTRYNLPLEIFYTIFPIIMVIVFFDHTVSTQNKVLNDPDVPVDNTVFVVGQQWSWTFNYEYTPPGESEPVNVYTVGTGSEIPQLHLPIDETTRFQLRSPDVIHDFGVPGFLVKMDVMPGQENYYQVTPQATGTYSGKCYELCGVYHSRMLFTVKIESREDYEAHLESLYEAGNVSPGPLCGGEDVDTQAGLEAIENPAEPQDDPQDVRYCT